MDFPELFDGQFRKLAELDYSRLAIDGLRQQRDAVLARIGNLKLSESDLPFMPVLTRPHWPMLEIMPRYKDKEGQTVIVNPNYVFDLAETPENPYYIFGIDIGKTRKGWLAKEAEKWVEKNQRRCLTVSETLSLGIFTDALKDDPRDYLLLMALGSCFREEGYPFIYPGPRLHHFPSLDVKTSNLCVPSCLHPVV